MGKKDKYSMIEEIISEDYKSHEKDSNSVEICEQNKEEIKQIKNELKQLEEEVKSTSEKKEQKIKKYRICTNKALPVRLKPSEDSKIVGEVSHGSIFDSSYEKNGWIRIIFKEEEAWIPKERVVLT